MPVAVKKLHMAKGLDELKKKECVLSKMENKKADQLAKSAKKLFKSATDEIKKSEKDEETIYIYLFRCMELWTMIWKTDDYKKDSGYYNDMYGKDMKHTLILLEEYTTKLEQRYNELNENVEEERSKDKCGADAYKIVTSINTKKLVKPVTLNDEDSYSDISNEDKKFIQCADLKELLPDFRGVLILDIRSKDDFLLSKIKYKHCVNIPETCIQPGLSAKRLDKVINLEEKRFWNERNEYKQLVLLDWHSEEEDVIPNSGLDNLLNILSKWDQVVYKRKPVVLVGGFERWLDTYPTLTTNPRVQRPQRSVNSTFTHLSEYSIEYPINDLNDIYTPKPREITIPPLASTSIPAVDRTTKPEKMLVDRDRNEPPLDSSKDATLPPPPEPMEEDTEVPVEEPEHTPKSLTSSPASTENLDSESSYSHVSSSTVHSTTPPRPKKTYAITPKKFTEKGIRDGDGEIYFEKLKPDSVSQSGGLKRSASSPNINKSADEDSSSSTGLFSPTFDRTSKPKPATDTIYQANNKSGKGLTGLKNLGNLCYMNSIMQCISNTVELTLELTRFKRDVSGRRQIVDEVSCLLRELWRDDTRVTSCRSLKAKVGALRQSFSTNDQQDSHEFLTLLIDWLHEDLNEPSHIESLEGAVDSTGERAWGEFKKKNDSLILKLFYGQLKSTVTCNHCNTQSVLFEPFSNLSIPLPPPQDMSHDKDRSCSLKECLKLYLRGESISGWVCPSCKTPREATKKLDITRLPPVLIIHLKRFMNEMVGVGWCRKRMNMIDFPISDFDMKPYTHQDSELRFHNYNLYAVSNHYGNMDSGHYTAYCKNNKLNKWYKFDDQDVNELSPHEIKSSAAYILFYKQSPTSEY